jgi:hypothetical protein
MSPAPQIAKLIKIALPSYEHLRQDELQPYRKVANRIVILITIARDGSYCGGLRAAAESLSTNDFGNRISATAGYFNVSGTADPLLFAQASVSGSAKGSPGSDGYLLNVAWWLQQNIGLTLQYTGYMKFNGAGTNYDGGGRNASANNSTYLMARFVF